MARRQVAIVPHTHWDREWYSPFQTFRLRLVDLLDEFLQHLEDDLSYARFLLDGQMAVVDDYLEVRPEAEARLRRLAASGRLAMGPWYTLPDEFLVSGETHIRNLQLGLERAAAFGGAMNVGYLPDMFGHVGQMPQILRQFGFEHAVVWRGVPAAIDRTAFWWSAPDGSTVRAQYLPSGYGNGASIPDDAKALIRRIAAHEAELGDMLAGGILFMNGTDHQVPQRWLGRIVAEANEFQDDYEISISSLAEFLDREALTENGELPAWKGELRSGSRANLLMGVTSNRVDVRQAAARAERELERRAEPLCALFMPEWPSSLLGIAWREVVRNAAHDSVCACSHDDVGQAVMHRYAEASQIADGLADRALRMLAATVDGEGPLIVNPSARPRGGVVELVVSDERPVPGTQVLSSRPSRVDGRRVRSSDLAALLGQIREQRLSETFFVNGVEHEDDGERLVVTLRLGTERVENPRFEVQRGEIYARIGELGTGWHEVRFELPPVQRLLARVDEVPGYGWTLWDPDHAGDLEVAVEVDGHRLTNGKVTVEVDPDTGTISVNGIAGFGRLVDGGDLGDTYNYCPPENDDIVDRPEVVAVRVVEAGPVRAVVEIDRTYRWPAVVDPSAQRRTGSEQSVVTTRVELQAGEEIVRVELSFENRSRDHRLRIWFPLPESAQESEAECAFAVVRRGLEAEGGPSERGIATFPSRRFVRAGGLTVVHDGVAEYELVDDGRALALTVLRATGMLSQGPMTYRPEPAGPLLRVDGPQMQTRVRARYAVHVGDGDAYAIADDAFLPLEVINASGDGSRPGNGSALSVAGAEVSAMVRRGDHLEVRVFNPTDAPTTVDFHARQGWLVDLRGRPLEPFDGTFDLGPWAIATARLMPV